MFDDNEQLDFNVKRDDKPKEKYVENGLTEAEEDLLNAIEHEKKELEQKKKFEQEDRDKKERLKKEKRRKEMLSMLNTLKAETITWRDLLQKLDNQYRRDIADLKSNKRMRVDAKEVRRQELHRTFVDTLYNIRTQEFKNVYQYAQHHKLVDDASLNDVTRLSDNFNKIHKHIRTEIANR